MIVFRYVTREVLLTTLAVSSVLVFVFLSNFLVRYLGDVAIGRYPLGFVAQMLLLELPHLLGLLLPLGLYLSILLVLGRMSADSELTVLAVGGVSRKRLSLYILWSTFWVSIVVAYLSLYLSPAILAERAQLREEARAATLVQMLVPGQFHQAEGGGKVIYVQSLAPDRTYAQHLFLAQKSLHKESKEKYWDIIVAEKGQVEQHAQTKKKYIVLKNGSRYMGIPGQNDFQVIKFWTYALQIPEIPPYQPTEARTFSTKHLLQQLNDLTMQAELQWRLSIFISVWLLSMLAISIGELKPRQGKYGKILPGALLYIIYANLLFMAKDWLKSGSISPVIGLWWTHALFGALIIFNFIKSHYRFNKFSRWMH